MVVEADSKMVHSLFGDWEETLIWSCLDQVMGYLYMVESEEPQSAMAILADFCYFAGTPAEELVRFKPDWCTQDFMIMVPQTEEWAHMIEKVYGERSRKIIRYATKKEIQIFDQKKLEEIIQGLDQINHENERVQGLHQINQQKDKTKKLEQHKEYHIEVVDEAVFQQCKATEWCHDLISQYETYESYAAVGLGVVIMQGNEIVSGASSYTVYRGGIEIEIDTREDHRRKGLALICGAALILACLKSGRYPSWDAQNEGSLRLAEKLGYHFANQYTAYEIFPY